MISLLAFLASVLVAASATAWLLRRAGLASNGIVAGLLVGVMLGPTVLGRIAPDWWENTVIGATEARSVLDHAEYLVHAVGKVVRNEARLGP